MSEQISNQCHNVVSLTILIVPGEDKEPEQFLVYFLMRCTFISVINYSCVFLGILRRPRTDREFNSLQDG